MSEAVLQYTKHTTTSFILNNWEYNLPPSHLLNIVVCLSQVAEHVTVVTVDISTEHFDVVFGAELVNAYHQVSGAACQTHLRDKKFPNKHKNKVLKAR